MILKRAVISLMFNLRPLALEMKERKKTLLAVYRVGDQERYWSLKGERGY